MGIKSLQSGIFCLLFILWGVLCRPADVLAQWENNYVQAERRAAIKQALDKVEGVPSRPQAAVTVYPPRPRPAARPFEFTPRERSRSPEKYVGPNDKRRKGIFAKYFDPHNPLLSFEISPEYFHHRYREPTIMKQDGAMFGLSGVYTYRSSENEAIKSWKDMLHDISKINTYKIEGMAAIGLLDFSSVTIGNNKNRRNYQYEFRGLVGYDIPTRQAKFTPYLGVGYRYINDNSPGRITSIFSTAFDFERETRYIYLPLGFDALKQINNRWSVNFNLEYDVLLYGRQINRYDDGGTKVVSATDNSENALDGLKFEQDGGYGIRGSLKVLRESERVNIFVEPFVRYWSIKNSDFEQFTSNGGRVRWYQDAQFLIPHTTNQPRNDTTELGVKMGLRY